MLFRNIKIGWIVALVVVFVLFSLRVATPALINMHNDGALIFALLLVGVTLTTPFVVFAKVIKPILNQEP